MQFIAIIKSAFEKLYKKALADMTSKSQYIMRTKIIKEGVEIKFCPSCGRKLADKIAANHPLLLSE